MENTVDDVVLQLLTSADVVTEAVNDGDAMSYTSRLHMRNVQDDMNGLYQCVITNSFGSSYSKKAEISVHGKSYVPWIWVSPSS